MVAETSQAKTKKTPSSPVDPSAVFEFPTKSTRDDPAFLKPLADESSTYTAVASICLQLTQYSSTCENDILHETSYAAFMTSFWEAAIKCLHNHTDRKCRIMIARCLGITGRAAYARIRPSPLTFTQRDPIPGQIQDLVGSDIASALCTAGLDDPDDGVSAAALSSIGILILSNNTSFGGIVEDDLTVHMNFAKSPYAPALRSVTDEDIAISLQELQARVLENVISPRLLQLIDRVIYYSTGQDQNSALPVLTAGLLYAATITVQANHEMDRITYSKRWNEVDISGLMDVMVENLILPAMNVSNSGCLARTAALSAVRLAHASVDTAATWIEPVCRSAAMVFREEVSASSVTETRLGMLSVMIIALRAVPLTERTRSLLWITGEILTLPSTVSTTANTAGLRIGDGMYRRPARVALWTEVALSFFIDGPAGTRKRQESLKQFLSSYVVTSIISTTDEAAKGVLNPRDELLVAFTKVAIDTGRRFRVAADGSIQVADTTAEAVREWLQLVVEVLTSFVPCSCAPLQGSFLEENLSLLSAGLSSYVLLLQEYLHFVGLLHPSTSAALKLATNALPPHVLWDHLTESAMFLSRFDIILDVEHFDTTTKLMDELVAQELKQGIHSHHMRLFTLALAADHWAQCRIASIRKHFEISKTSKNNLLSLNVQSAREILRALAPKRLLAKIMAAHVPPVDSEGKPKRDPIKKLALESVRVSVACIETIALMACDWRRRFGSSQESKHIVSVAVGLLQGKVDETPVDDLMKSVMGPTCEAAVGRIQAFYENPGQGGENAFPLSELVTQPVRIKIKPLVSSSRPNRRLKEDVMREYLMQLCRQTVASRIPLAVYSSPPADSILSAARPNNWLRLSIPPVPESQDGRLHGFRGEALSAWGHSVIDASPGSDPSQLIVAYTPRRYYRHDGEDDYRITILMKAFNMTPVDFPEGIRMEFSITQRAVDEDDAVAAECLEALGVNDEDFIADTPLTSASALYKHEVKSGDFLSWEVPIDHLTASNSLYLVPTIVYLNIPLESESAGADWVGEKPLEGETSTVGGESKSGEDDFQVTTEGTKSFQGEKAEAEHVRISGEPLNIPPVVLLQPCPLVFFRDRCGDSDSFRFFWFRFQYHLVPMKIELQSRDVAHSINPITSKIAEMASLAWDGEAIPGGHATRLWAFMTYTGHRVFCVLTESESSGPQGQLNLYFRGDDEKVLHSIAASKLSRDAVVSSLLPGMTCSH